MIPEVRAALVAFQRAFARRDGGAVLDGRDIGTVICPEAEVKIFVTASAGIRAHRRWLEVGGDEARVLAEVMARDDRDRNRADAPLKPAADASILDTTDLGIDAAVAAGRGPGRRAVAQALTRFHLAGNTLGGECEAEGGNAPLRGRRFAARYFWAIALRRPRQESRCPTRCFRP